MKTLVFVRRRISVPFAALARLLAGGDIVIYSDERVVQNAIWWMDEGCVESDDLRISLDDAVVDDMVMRCRLLRELDRAEAMERIHAALANWRRILVKEKVDGVLSLPIDSYVTHALLIASTSLDIPFTSVVGTAIDGRIRFTRLGEYQASSQEAMQEEVRAFIGECRQSVVTPYWLIGVDSKAYVVGLRRVLVDAIKPAAFFFYRLLWKDPKSFSFSPSIYQKKLMFATLSRYFAAMSLERNPASSLPGRYALAPLQFYPEVTSDYWIREEEMHNHHRSMLAVIGEVAKRMPVVVKEHPAAFSRRSARFLKKLSAIPNVLFVPMGTSLGGLMKECEFIIGQASTTTFQAQVMGKKVAFLGEPYFGTLATSHVITDLAPTHINDVVDALLHSNSANSEEEVFAYVQGYFQATGSGAIGGFTYFLETSKAARVGSWAGTDLKEMFRRIVLYENSETATSWD